MDSPRFIRSRLATAPQAAALVWLSCVVFSCDGPRAKELESSSDLSSPTADDDPSSGSISGTTPSQIWPLRLGAYWILEAVNRPASVADNYRLEYSVAEKAPARDFKGYDVFALAGSYPRALLAGMCVRFGAAAVTSNEGGISIVGAFDGVFRYAQESILVLPAPPTERFTVPSCRLNINHLALGLCALSTRDVELMADEFDSTHTLPPCQGMLEVLSTPITAAGRSFDRVYKYTFEHTSGSGTSRWIIWLAPGFGPLKIAQPEGASILELALVEYG